MIASRVIAAGIEHAAAMAAVHAQSFPPAERWGADAFALQLPLPGVFGLIAPAGGIVLARVVADEAEILTLAVIPAARRMGLGRLLLCEARMVAAVAGALAMFLEVSEANLGAWALYASMGFLPVGRRRNYYPDRSDALVLRLEFISDATKDV